MNEEEDVNEDVDGIFSQPQSVHHTDDINGITDEFIEKSDLIMTFLNNRKYTDDFCVTENFIRYIVFLSYFF